MHDEKRDAILQAYHEAMTNSINSIDRRECLNMLTPLGESEAKRLHQDWMAQYYADMRELRNS